MPRNAQLYSTSPFHVNAHTLTHNFMRKKILREALRLPGPPLQSSQICPTNELTNRYHPTRMLTSCQLIKTDADLDLCSPKRNLYRYPQGHHVCSPAEDMSEWD